MFGGGHFNWEEGKAAIKREILDRGLGKEEGGGREREPKMFGKIGKYILCLPKMHIHLLYINVYIHI